MNDAVRCLVKTIETEKETIMVEVKAREISEVASAINPQLEVELHVVTNVERLGAFDHPPGDEAHRDRTIHGVVEVEVEQHTELYCLQRQQDELEGE